MVWKLALILLPGLATAQSSGLAPEWETRKWLGEFATEVKRLKPVLDQIKPQDWLAKGASQGYIVQLKSTQDAVRYVVGSIDALAAHPDKVPLVLETFLRLQSLDAVLDSLGQGVRNYQNPALADLLQGVAAANSNNREKLRQYLVDLADAKEAEFTVMDQEAQRCRSAVTRAPATQRQPVRKEQQQ